MGGRDGRNSISDAEQLLCIMYPATELNPFRLAVPDETAEDVLDALRGLGDGFDIPRLLISALTEYMERHTDDSGSPIFSGGSYFSLDELSAEQIPAPDKLDVVDSFSMSITLTLATLAFIRNYRPTVPARRETTRHEMDQLEELSSTRLTAAMVGLLRSFSVHVFDPQSQAGRILCGRSNQGNLPERQVIKSLQDALLPARSNLRTLTIGSGQAVADLESTSRFFECGWSWGIVKDADLIGTDNLSSDTLKKFAQPAGVAVEQPWLYFTGIALDGIEDLFSERTQFLGLLNEEQRQLSYGLRLRRDITQSYWSTIATFGTERWPLEDLPWCTSDGQESDYFSLQVSSMVVQNLVRRRASADPALRRVGAVLQDLANRGRINRRPMSEDSALALHAPGVRLRLRGSENAEGQPMGWVVSNFAPLLLKRTFAVAELVRDADLRGSLLTLADNVWDHLVLRQLKDGSGRDLWDQPRGAFKQLDTHHELPSWYFTERVVECLIAAANLVERAPLHNPRLTEIATALLYEADHLFDRQLLRGSEETGSLRGVLQAARTNLHHAWDILNDRPGSAAALASEVLREFERLEVARQAAAEGA